MKDFLRKNIFFVISVTLLLFPTISFADPQTTLNPGTSQTILNPGSSQTTLNPGSGFQLQNPLNVNTICGLIQALLSAFIAIGTPIAVLFLIYAGFLFVTARGNPTKLQNARSNLVHVILGIGIFLGAWFLGQIIASTINAIQPGTVSSSNSCN